MHVLIYRLNTHTLRILYLHTLLIVPKYCILVQNAVYPPAQVSGANASPTISRINVGVQQSAPNERSRANPNLARINVGIEKSSLIDRNRANPNVASLNIGLQKFSPSKGDCPPGSGHCGGSDVDHRTAGSSAKEEVFQHLIIFDFALGFYSLTRLTDVII
jgi:hypothetical protein